MNNTLTWHTNMIDNNVAACPDCGEALHLYNRPINVKFYKCSACDAEFSTEYMRGYWDGKTRAERTCTACGCGDGLHEDDCPVAAELVHQSAPEFN